jgi:murein DD-endopeptidase MepM/ murein hydrolase activator NlpD
MFLRDSAPAALGGQVRSRRLPWFATGLGLPMFALGFVRPDASHQETMRLDAVLTEIKPVFTLPLLLNSTDLISAGAFGNPEAADAASDSVTLKVGRGDTLDRLFRRQGLDLNQLAAIMQLGPARQNLRLLKPGDEVQVRHDAGEILEVTRQLDAFNTLSVTRAGDGFDAQVVALAYQTQSARASGEIRSSLFEAAAQAGISDATIMKLASIFASEIDFVLDLREGDQFTLVYEEMWRDGRRLLEGDILAAEFINQGRSYRAVRYQASDGKIGYYTPEGKSLRKAFVRAPLTFSRVSSNFNPRRRHPILNTIRAHTGVDYAAPAGTPVRAPGDGKVIFRGRKGGYGNAIILQHAGGVTTLYGHLSGFARTIRDGRHVSQGDVIGFVGATGLATAPHLHYEYRINGRYMNPRTVKLPDAATPIDASEREIFLRAAAPLIERLDAGRAALAADKAPNKAGRTT